MELTREEFEVLLHLIRVMEEKELSHEDITGVVSGIVRDFESQLTTEQKAALRRDFPHLFKAERRALGRDVPLYDYY